MAKVQAIQTSLPLEGMDGVSKNCPLVPSSQALKAINSGSIAEGGKLAAYDWHATLAAVDQQGWTVLPSLMDAQQCQHMAALYDESSHFRSRIVMQRHAFGRGEYQYLAYPLPPLVQTLRSALYTQLQPLAERWRAILAPEQVAWPLSHADFIVQCHAAGQLRPTPLLLRYGAGDYNCLHQDLYGEQVFPLQVIIMLSQPGRDFEGGELVLTEQRPRMQSRAQVLTLHQGDAAIIAVRERPVAGSRGYYRVQHRHGVSTITQGQRHTLGIVLHDAQ